MFCVVAVLLLGRSYGVWMVAMLLLGTVVVRVFWVVAMPLLVMYWDILITLLVAQAVLSGY